MIEGLKNLRTSCPVLTERSRYYWNILRSSTLVHKVLETYITRIINIALGLITSVIIARLLGPEGKGVLAVMTTVGAMGVQFGNVGLHATNTYFVSKDRSLLESLLGNSIFVSFGVGTVGVLAAYALFTLFPEIAPLQGTLLILALLWVPFGLADLLFQNLLIGIQEISVCNRLELFKKILNIALVLLSLLVIFNATSIYSIALATMIIGVGWEIFRLSQHLRGHPRPSIGVFRRTAGYGFISYLGSLFMYLLLKMDLLMVNNRLGEGPTGLYSMAVTIADLLMMLPIIVNTVLFPMLTPIADYREKWKKARPIIFVTLSLMFCTCAVAAVFATPIVTLLYGQAFLGTVPALVTLLPGIFLLSAGSMLGNFVASIDNARSGPIFSFSLVVLNYLLNDILIDKYGITGAAIASVICYSLYIPYTSYYLVRVLRDQNYRIVW